MKQTNNGKFNYNLFYVAATLLFVASTISAICGKNSGGTLGLGGLCLVLGTSYADKAKNNKNNEENKANEENKDNENNEENK